MGGVAIVIVSKGWLPLAVPLSLLLIVIIAPTLLQVTKCHSLHLLHHSGIWDPVIPFASRELTTIMTSLTVRCDLQKLATPELPIKPAASCTSVLLILWLNSMLSGPSCGPVAWWIFQLWYTHYCLLF